MTVYNELNKIAYIGSAEQTLYPIPFEYISTDDIKVSVYTSNNEFVEDWTYSTQYVIEGGNVKVLSGYNIDNTKKLLILRSVDLIQDNKYREGGDFPAKSTETSFDKLTMITQQLQETLDRCVKVDVLDIQTPEELLQTVYDKLDSATVIAGDAISAANQAQTAADNATAAVNSAEQTLVQTQAYVDSAKVEIDNTKNTAINTVNSTVAQAKADINTAVSNAESNISTIVSDAEGSITNIAVTEANKAIANAAQEATDIATANLNSYVDGTVKPSLQTYVDQAQADANSAATSMEQAALSATAASNYASNASADAVNAAESAGLAANSASEASIHNFKNKITNCITEIPQDIKLKLNNGTLTLKAGSKVYVPNGSGVFDTVTIASDITNTTTGAGEKMFLSVYNNGTKLFAGYTTGGTVTERPVSPIHYALYYNTTTNKVEFYNGSTWVSDCSFPIAIVTRGADGFTSIDQVFNGFGYIGSCLFALPGVKLLMPNGRNSDGSLNNLEYTISKVVVSEEVPGNNNYFLGFTSGGGFKRNQVFSGFYVSDSFISTSSQWCLLFNTTDNFYYSTGDYGATWNKYTILAQIGTFTGNNGKISRLNIRQPFRAVDYNDYAREVDNTVHKTGNEDIYNRKNFIGSGIGIVKSGTAIDIQNKNVDLSVTDGSVYGTSEIHFIDKNGKVQGIFEHQNTTDGKSVAIMAARNHANNGWATVNVGFDANNVAYAVTTTPPANSNGSNIATTAWVRKYGAQLDYSAAITISGTGEKTATASGVLIMTGKGSSAAGSFKITIDGQTFNCTQSYSGSDYNHATFAYFPVGNGQSYTVDELSGSCDLRLIPYK